MDRRIRGFFIFLDISVEKVCFRRARGIIDNHAQRILDHNRCIAPGYHHQQSHSVSGTTTASSNLFVPPKRRFPYWAATIILYTHHRYPPQFRSLHNLSPVLSASGSSPPSIRQPSFFFSPGMGYFRRASSGSRSGTVDCGELWGCRERLRLLGG